MIEYIEVDTDLNPVEVYKLIRESYDYTFLLESVEGPEKFVTQSVIGFEPLNRLKIQDNALFIDDNQIAEGIDNIKTRLHEIIETYQGGTDRTQQFVGGLVGFTSYDIIRYIEDLPQDDDDDQIYPDAAYGLYLDGIRFDHQNQSVQYFYHSDFTPRIEELTHLFKNNVPITEEFEVKNVEYTFAQEDYENAVRAIKEGIVAGETFQTVISQRINFTILGDHMYMYEQLRQINPSPYMYYLELGEYTVIGSSPELLVSVEKETVTTYPIAGTRPLGETMEENNKLAEELLYDEKERAEHNMLVDLARNDIGIVSAFNSVEVTDYMDLEYFSHVMHLVSKVQGQLKEDLTMFDAFFSTFPAGTVSGAPKIRSMELIGALEPVNRGPYAGSVGYFGINNETVQAITIRTTFGKRDRFSIQAGAGIVLDSDPEKEYEETLHKLAALLKVIKV